MFRLLLPLILVAGSAAGQYKAEPAGAPPAELAPAIAQALSPAGTKILGADGQVVVEFWFRAAAPTGAQSAEPNVTLTSIPHGALLGVARYSKPGQDRRGQTIKPGIYTLRFSYFPEDGAHQGVAPQRDFLILCVAAEDAGPSAAPDYNTLMRQAGKASGTPHPAILSIWKAGGDFKPGLEKWGEHDWVLQTKLGEVPIAVIVIGVAEG